MSVRMSVGDYSFRLLAENKSAALNAALVAFNWEHEDEPPTLEGMFDAMNWCVRHNGRGDIDNILFQDDSMGGTLKFLDAIAPWVEAGSFLCVILDNDPVRWFFDGRRLIEQMPVYQ